MAGSLKSDSNLQRKKDMIVRPAVPCRRHIRKTTQHPRRYSESTRLLPVSMAHAPFYPLHCHSPASPQAERTRQRQMEAELAKEKRRQVVERQQADRQRKVEALKYRHAVQPKRDIAV